MPDNFSKFSQDNDAQPACPVYRTAQIEAFLQGQGRPAELQEWENHLKTCEICQTAANEDALLRRSFTAYQADPFFEQLSAAWKPDFSRLPLPEKAGLKLAQPGDEAPLLPDIEEETPIRKLTPRYRRALEVAAGLVVALVGLIALLLWNSYNSVSGPGSSLPAVTSKAVSQIDFVWKITATTLTISKPGGVATDNRGNFYIAENYYHLLLKLDKDGLPLLIWSRFGTGDGEVNAPRGLTVDEQGNVYVADTNNHRLQKFDNNGKFLAKWGDLGSGDGQFNKPWAVAVDQQGNIFVADTNNHRIQKLDKNGQFLTGWGSLGTALGQFSFPEALAIDGQGNVYVADSGNHRIQKFDNNGKFLTTWGKPGQNDGEFNEPQGLALDRQGNVYVADTGNHRLQKFDSQGRFLVKYGSSGDKDGQFDTAQALALDNQGNIYVSDSALGRIQKFRQS